MGDDASAEARRGLVEHLRRHGWLTDDRVAEAFLATPRETFLPSYAERHGLAAVYRDEAIVTRTEPATGLPLSSSSQPAIMARMLEMLDLREGLRVLEVGAGTGYNAALLARLVGPRGSVTSLELDGELAASAREALLAARSPARVVIADGREGAPEAAPLDRIVATASSEAVPRAWFDQLAPGGLLVVPLRLSRVLFAVQAVVAFRKVSSGFDAVTVTAGGFMALRHRDDPPVRPASVVAPEAADGEHDRARVDVTGPALAGLDGRARGRLAVTALGFARRWPVDLGGGSGWALGAYAALALPEERLVELSRPAWLAAGQRALGVLDAVDGSLAALVTDGAGAHLEAHGDRGAERTLGGVVERWQAAGRPGVEALRVRVRYGPERPHAWRTLRRGDQWIALDWRRPDDG